MIYHVLPGDAQIEAFEQSGIEGELLVCREVLVEGDLSGESLDEFFTNRAAFINSEYDDDPALYNANVASQFRRLLDVKESDEVNLWFEYELFCSVNMWFCLSLLESSKVAIYRVSPVFRDEQDRWDGFGGADADKMMACYKARLKLTDENVRLGADLWRAYKTKNRNELLRLSTTKSEAFPYLKEIGEAAVNKERIPATVIAEIQSEGINNFNEIFLEFRRRAGIFGFGDSQVKNVMAASAK
ncbi:MAG TPA: hypothetical protein VEV84_07350 [Pyrinomonadaceae bacterium]|nr:hypothetical protein [Pyrinomonadaceae bacterium]